MKQASTAGAAENAVRLMLRSIRVLLLLRPPPGNFFVHPDGSIVLIDFGMVGYLDESCK
jgi:predicted unusual protein kinase regulating ubiquinone biosynthesis (AarF/ABC1/UbiB family)